MRVIGKTCLNNKIKKGQELHKFLMQHNTKL